MDEKILIKSEMDKKARAIFLTIVVAFWVATIAFLVFLLSPNDSPYGMSRKLTNLDMALRGYFPEYIVIECLLFVFAIILMITYWAHSKCELFVTEKNVKGKTIFGKEVVLPIYMISAYSTRSFMSIIAVATSSGLTKFALI